MIQNPNLRTRTRFSGVDIKQGKAGILIIEKRTADQGLIVQFEVGIAEDEIRILRDQCNRRLKELAEEVEVDPAELLPGDVVVNIIHNYRSLITDEDDIKVKVERVNPEGK